MYKKIQYYEKQENKRMLINTKLMKEVTRAQIRAPFDGEIISPKHKTIRHHRKREG
jgi:hypothetical protein